MNALIARVLAAIGAPLIGAATLSQGWLSVAEMRAEGATTAEGVWRYLSYFTVLTNALVVVVLARSALRPVANTGVNAPRFELLAVASILFVGAVYNLLLASQWDPQGLRLANDIVLHAVSPLLFAAYWLLRPRGALDWGDALFAAAWPLVYSCYGLTRGAFDGYYPYFFMDPTTTPLPQLLINMAGLVAAFMAAALLLIGVDRTVRRPQPQN